MSKTCIALANVRLPATREESLDIVLDAMTLAASSGAKIVCFPECILPGYRIGVPEFQCDRQWLVGAWASVDNRALELGITVILGTERIEGDRVWITARVTYANGQCAGFQDKVQLDPSEESTYTAGTQRRVFRCGDMIFGIVICHEGWRYPETVRWAARHGAHVVFHPHVEVVEEGRPTPTQFVDPANTFHEKAALCRAAENTCYFATVNCALAGSTTTSALIDPDGVLLAHQPHGHEGILFGEIDTERATGLLAKRLKSDLI